MISFTSTGSFKNTERFLKKMSRGDIFKTLGTFGEQGVVALSNATPRDTGRTADAWRYETQKTRGGYSISWHNDNVNDGKPIAILIQYGHGTGTGGYVQGRDYINPAIRPVFDKIAEDVWKAVRSA